MKVDFSIVGSIENIGHEYLLQTKSEGVPDRRYFGTEDEAKAHAARTFSVKIYYAGRPTLFGNLGSEKILIITKGEPDDEDRSK